MRSRQREDAAAPERAPAAPARSPAGPDPVAAALLGLRLSGAPVPSSVVARAALPNHLLAPLLSGRAPTTAPGDAVERAAREAAGDGSPTAARTGARLHTGDDAAAVAALLQARAVTYGADVYFGAGQSPSGALLAHELAHVRQQAGGAPYVARDDLTQMSIGADYAHALDPQGLQTAITDLRARLPGLTDPAGRMAAEGNLALLEREAAADADFAGAYAPGVVELGPEVLEASIGMSVAAPQAAPAGPIAAAGLVRDELLADYVRQTRAMLLFRMDATAQFLDTVARSKLTDPQGAVSEDTVAMLRTAAVEANRLGERVWIAKRLVDSITFLLANEPPPGSPAPQIAGLQTVGSHQYISTFYEHSAMLSRGYPPELPDVPAALDRLGLPPAVTEDEITASIRDHLRPEQAWERGMEVMERQGRVTDWGPSVVGERFEWHGARPSEEEIRAAGVAAATADPQRRAAERDLLQSVRRPAPEDETSVLDVGAVHPAYNYVALRFVLNRFLADARARLADDMAALDRHLDSVPPLRGYVSGWMVFLNEFLKGRGYRPIVDPDDVDANNVIAKLNEIVAALASTRAKVAGDDDYLFDSGIMPALAPIIDLYAQVDPQYGEWIRAVVKNNDRWREAVSVLLGAAALIGFGLAALLTGGLAVGGLAVGVGATVGGAVRSRARADELKAMALSGLGGFDAAAVANFVAWIDTASAVLTVAPVLARGLRAAVGDMSVALRAGRAADGAALVRAGPAGLVSLPRAAGRTLEWEFADVVFDPLSGEARVFAKHLGSGEIFHLRVNVATGDGSLTHVATGTAVPVAGGRPVPARPLLTAGEPVPPPAAMSTPAPLPAPAPQVLPLAGGGTEGAFTGTVRVTRPLDAQTPVWVNRGSRVFHPPGSRGYGAGRAGRLETYERAQALGLRMAETGTAAVTEVTVTPLQGTFVTLRGDLDQFRAFLRRTTGAVRVDLPASAEAVRGGTVAVARTDIPGFETRRWVGGSPQTGVVLREPPPQVVRSPFDTPQAHGHAEEMLANQLIRDLRGLPPEALRGRTVSVIVEQQPCAFCMAGLGDMQAHAGVLLQWSRQLPLATIEIWNPRTMELLRVRGGTVIP